MSEVLLELNPYVRGEMATKLLAAARELGFPVSVIKSQSEGFLVPTEVHQYLFPSQYSTPDPIVPPVIDPAADFAGLDDDELEALTDPDN
jgi:hypothetical protein